MKIIFVITKEIWDEYLVDFSTKLIEFLKTRHQLAILTNENVELTIDQYKLQDINLSEWDLVIVQDSVSQGWIAEAVEKTETPIIFFSHNEHWKLQPILSKNLLKVFCFYNGKVICIPKEMVQHIDRPIFGGSGKNKVECRLTTESVNKKTKVIHFHQSNDFDLIIAKSVIDLANASLDLELDVIAEKGVRDLLKPLCNRNVTLIDSQLWNDDSLIGYPLAITSGSYALKTLFYNVPTIVVGKTGFGGLVKSETLAEHLRWRFSGRFGGEIDEVTPYWILYDEVQVFKTDLNYILKDTGKISCYIRDKFDPVRTFAFLESQMDDLVADLKTAFSKKPHTLKPVVLKDIKIEKTSKENTYLMFRDNNKIVGIISSEEIAIIQQLAGEKSIKQIAEANEMDVEDIAEFVRDLWYQKVINFRNE